MDRCDLTKNATESYFNAKKSTPYNFHSFSVYSNCFEGVPLAEQSQRQPIGSKFENLVAPGEAASHPNNIEIPHTDYGLESPRKVGLRVPDHSLANSRSASFYKQGQNGEFQLTFKVSPVPTDAQIEEVVRRLDNARVLVSNLSELRSFIESERQQLSAASPAEFISGLKSVVFKYEEFFIIVNSPHLTELNEAFENLLQAAPEQVNYAFVKELFEKWSAVDGRPKLQIDELPDAVIEEIPLPAVETDMPQPLLETGENERSECCFCAYHNEVRLVLKDLAKQILGLPSGSKMSIGKTEDGKVALLSLAEPITEANEHALDSANPIQLLAPLPVQDPEILSAASPHAHTIYHIDNVTKLILQRSRPKLKPTKKVALLKQKIRKLKSASDGPKRPKSVRESMKKAKQSIAKAHSKPPQLRPKTDIQNDILSRNEFPTPVSKVFSAYQLTARHAPDAATAFSDSKLLNRKEQEQLRKLLSGLRWAERLYSSKTDSKTASGFHNACDYKTGTLVIVKSGAYIGGGYSDQVWNGTGYKHSINSFLFSLQKGKIYKVSNCQKAIFCDPKSGPIFGGKLTRRYRYQSTVSSAASELKRR